jgi:hypothetical protein
MKTMISLAICAVVFAAALSLTRSQRAEANVFDNVAGGCRDSHVCTQTLKIAWKGQLQGWLTNLFNGDAVFGGSWAEECIVEGCTREEQRETWKFQYREEMIKESGGNQHEVLEIAVAPAARKKLTRGEEGFLVFSMLDGFDWTFGWQVRVQDRLFWQNESYQY